MSIRMNEIINRNNRELARMEAEKEAYVADIFENKREYVQDLIMDQLANEYWLRDFRGLDKETVGERVLDIVKQVEDYLWEQK